MADVRAPVVFHVEPQGRLGNRMIQYMAALKFQSQVPDCRIANVTLPEWGILHPRCPLPPPVEYAARQQHIDIPGLAARARGGELGSVVLTGFGQRMENLLDADAYRAVFRSPLTDVPRFDAHHLVCPVRAEDVLDLDIDHPYPLTPVEFYRDIVAETGLTPVFIGQLAPNAYTNRLREAFPQARFLPTGDPMRDFAMIRGAKNILLGVTTFGWVAAWLSQADRIFMTVSGLFNPMQERTVDLLPLGDPRYRFYLFPINYGVPLRHHAAMHARIAPFWRLVSHQTLQILLGQAPRFDPPIEAMLRELDPQFYLASNPDVAVHLRGAGLEQIRDHYRSYGSAEGRVPFRFAAAWYAARHPVAAFEVGQGDFTTLAHHYIAVGRARGWRAVPPETESEP